MPLFPEPQRTLRTVPAVRWLARWQSTGVATWAMLALWALLWVALLAATSLSPPVDNAEQLAWVRSLEWGYHKHPPLPTLLLWPLVQLFGLHEGVTYAAAAVVTVAALLLARGLVRELCGARLANLALLGALCIGYYNQRLVYYNHDTLLLLAVSAAAWCCWRALVHRSPRAWWLLGLVMGLGALAKYQVVIAGASVLACWSLAGGWRDAAHRRGLLQAVAVAVLVFSPHAVWLVTHDFQPFHYMRANGVTAAMTVAQCSVSALRWIGNQLSQLAGPLLLGAGLALWSRRAAPVALTAPPPVDRVAARWFLLCWGVLPLVLMPLIAVLLRGELRMNWGTAFMPFTCAAALAWLGTGVWARWRWRDVLTGFALVQLVLAGYLIATRPGPVPEFNQHRSRNFASQQVADRLAAPARAELGGHIQVIAGPQRLASVLALRLAERPLVLIDGRFDWSPWLPPGLEGVCGIVWVGGPDQAPPALTDRHELDGGLWWAVERLSDDPNVCR